MKKITLMLSLVFILVSCAHKSSTRNIYSEIENLEYKNHSLLKDRVSTILAEHKEFDTKMKLKIQSVIFTSLDKSMEIKKKESRIAQLLLMKTIVNKGSFDEIVKIKQKMKRLYKFKYSLFEDTANKLKSLLGIKSGHHKFLMEIEPFLHR